MSFNTLKNTLNPCSSYSSSSSSVSSSFAQPTQTIDSVSKPISRKPPKSSLIQQLQRLQEPSVPPQTQDTQLSPHPPEPEAADFSTRSEPAAVIQYESTGPFEPLTLSSPGEIPVVQVPASINCRLLEHQREGVRFLYSLYKNNHGGILGDDMGLGKTIQTIAFLAAVLRKDSEHCDSKMQKTDSMGKKGLVLIVCPTSVIQNWENEFSEWGTFSVAVYHGANRDLMLEKLEAGGLEILITSFDTFRIHDKILLEVQWDIVVVDEAHRLKNEKSQLYKACLGIKTRKRFGLTGTIMQNKILELFNLFDWVAPGSLGTREHFRDFYDEPLKHGQRFSAPERFVQIADERKKHLVAVLRKYLLRRTKEETIGHLMMGKEDNVVFCAMSELQRRAYKRMLELPDIQCLVNKDQPCGCGSPLTQVECCNRIVPNGIIWSYLHKDSPEGCDSCPFCLVLPCIIKLQQISNHLELIKPNPRDDPDKQRKDAELAAAVFSTDIDLVGGIAQSESFMNLSDVEHCGKMRALGKLMSSWLSRGDKILLFSYSVRMLDILEKFLIRKGYCFSRLDGSTPMTSRQSLVDEFNSSPSKQVFLISTRAGGLGLNLVSANRVVIFDPNWNPAQDLQAQDRTFRYGQKRHVVVFRLLSAGSLEELVYSRQVYKQQLSNIAISGKLEKRYFEGVQDCKEFQGELFGICNLFRDLSDKLFTSEIIELHKKHGQESSHDFEDVPMNKKTLDVGLQLLSHHSPKQADDASLLGAEVGKSGTQDIATKSRKDMPVLAALLDNSGVMYAHRNEDIVNAGPSNNDNLPLSREKAGGIISLPWSTQDLKPARSAKLQKSNKDIDNNLTKRKATDCNHPEEAGKNEEDKGRKKQKSQKKYGQLADFKGMGELEFSKWLLSASSSERKHLLEDFNNHMKQQKEKHGEDC